MLVNTIARGKLTSKKGANLSEREIELNINLARDAVELVNGSSGSEETKQTALEEGTSDSTRQPFGKGVVSYGYVLLLGIYSCVY